MNKTWNINPDNFCISPWTTMRIGERGDISYCKRAIDVGVYSDNFDLGYEYNNNEHFIQARNSFLNGEFASGCDKCVNEISNNGKFRQGLNKLSAIYNNYLEESLVQSPSSYRLTSNNIQPAHILVMFNNECNMACRMCSVKHSNLLSKLEGGDDKPQGWSKDTTKWDNFKKFIQESDKLEVLQLNGGEPLIQEEVNEILDIVKDKTNLQVVLTTNGTVYHSSIFDKFENFKSTFIDFSIECFHDNNNYIRTGYSWQKIKENIHKFILHRSEKINFGLHSTIQIYSIDQLHTTLDFCIENNLELIANVVFDLELRVGLLPKDYREQLYNQYYKKFEDVEHVSVKRAHDSIKQQLLSTYEPSEELLINFLKRTRRQDSIFGTDFYKEYPHLVGFFKNYEM